MVPREDHIDASLLGGGDRAAQVGVIGVLRLQLDTDPNWAAGVRQLKHQTPPQEVAGTAIRQVSNSCRPLWRTRHRVRMSALAY